MILRCTAAFLLVLSAPAIGAVTKTVVLAQGDLVPGQASATNWVSFSDACVDQEGGLIARARTTRGDCIVYKSLAAPVVVRAREFQSVAVPGDPGAKVIVNSVYEGDRPIRAVGAGKFIFVANLYNYSAPPGGWNAIVYSDETGLHLVSRMGDVIPGRANSSINEFGWMRLYPNGTVVFTARDTKRGYDFSVLQRSTTGVEAILPSPVFLQKSVASDGLALGSGELYGVGQFALANQITVKPGLARLTPGAMGIIAQDGDLVPGQVSERFQSLPELRSCNAAGDVLIQWRSRQPNQYYAEYGLWMARANGAIDRVASNAYAPSAVVNARGDVAYLSEGLQLKRAGQPIETIVSTSQSNPELRYLKERLSIDAHGNVVFQTNAGIWIHTSENETLSIARVGESFTYDRTEYKISELGLVDSASGGEDGRQRIINDWGQVAFVARLSAANPSSGGSTDVNVLMMATLPVWGDPAKRPKANPDTIIIRSGFGEAAKVDVLANDVNPMGDPVSVEIVTQGTLGKVSVQDGSVVYTPGKLFTGEDSFQYLVSSVWGSSEAVTVVVRNPYRNGSGTYGTEVLAGADPIGTANLTLSKTGRVTGAIRFGDRLLAVNDVLENGTFQRVFTFRGGETVTLTLRIEITVEGSVRISGTIHSSTGADFEIKPTACFGLPADLKAMKVTGQFRTDGDASLPKGIGFLVGTLSSGGRLITSGRLPDNRPFSASSRMKVDGTLEFDCAPYGKGRGRVHGLFAEVNGGPNLHQWSASLRWTKVPTPGSISEGIDGTMSALFATYAPAPGFPAISTYNSTASGVFTAKLGSEFQVSKSLTWSRGDVVVFPPPNLNRVQLRVSRSNGIVSGNYRNSNQELRPFKGVVYLMGNGAVGLVIGDQKTGSFVLYAN